MKHLATDGSLVLQYFIIHKLYIHYNNFTITHTRCTFLISLLRQALFWRSQPFLIEEFQESTSFSSTLSKNFTHQPQQEDDAGCERDEGEEQGCSLRETVIPTLLLASWRGNIFYWKRYMLQWDLKKYDSPPPPAYSPGLTHSKDRKLVLARATSLTLNQWLPVWEAQCAVIKLAFNAPFNQAASFITMYLLCTHEGISDPRFLPSGPPIRINTCNRYQSSKLHRLFWVVHQK